MTSKNCSRIGPIGLNMIHSEEHPVKYNTLIKARLSILAIKRLITGFSQKDMINIFSNKNDLETKSLILDEYLKQYFNTEYIVSIIDSENDPMVEDLGVSSRSRSNPFNFNMADIFPDNKSFYLYKLMYPEDYDQYLQIFNYKS